MVTVKRVSSNKDLKRFIHFHYDLNRSDHAFIGDLYQNQKNLLTTRLNPFFEHAKGCYFMAYRSNKVVGRIAVVHNLADRPDGKKDCVQFGFFDSINDQEVANKLFGAVLEQAKEWGLSAIEGPKNFTFNDSLGIQVEGFNHSPFYEMPHNPPYYEQLIRGCGFKKSVDLFAYYIATGDFPDRLIRAKPVLVSRFAQRGIRVRNFDPMRFWEDVDSIAELYNRAWVSNQGFVPVSNDEFHFYFRKYKKFLDPDLIYLAEKDGQLIGFSLTLPNLNDIYTRLKRGKRPILEFLLREGRTRKIKTIRIVAIGVENNFRRMGIDSYFYIKTFEAAQYKGYIAGEASRVLENNEVMNNAMAKMDAQLYKRYRLYTLSI